MSKKKASKRTQLIAEITGRSCTDVECMLYIIDTYTEASFDLLLKDLRNEKTSLNQAYERARKVRKFAMEV